jgi:Flp pilus assembly protein TadG
MRDLRRGLSHDLPARPGNTWRSRRAANADGQSLVEFALLAPLFLLMVVGLIEFSFAFNASLNTNYASRAGGLMAAEAGNASAADCLILGAIEEALSAPTDPDQVASVEVQRTNPSGSTVYATTTYQRSGSTSCTRTDGTTMSVPYSAVSNGYPASQRCNVLPPNGCPTLSPVRSTVDTIAVQITYRYPWHTPLGALMSMFGQTLSSPGGLAFTDRNVFRIEPIL